MAGTLHHVMARGIEGTNKFETDKDRNDFVDRPAAQCETGGLKVFALALIPKIIENTLSDSASGKGCENASKTENRKKGKGDLHAF